MVWDASEITNDPTMPFLDRTLDRIEVQRQFQHHLSSLGRCKDIEIQSIRPIRYKPERRCLIEYDVVVKPQKNAPPEVMTLMGKVRAKGLDLHSYQLVKSLWSAGFSADSEDYISVPEPIGTIPDFQMWLQRKVPGVVSTELLGRSGGIDLARRIVDAAHKLHQANIPSHRIHSLTDELNILHALLPKLFKMHPQWKERLKRILKASEELGAAIPTSKTTGIHRDFYPDQVLVDGSRLYLLDLDLYCQGDPALDIGNFIAHITEQSLRTLGSPDALVDREAAMEQRLVELRGETIRAAVRAYNTLTLVRHIYISTIFPERSPFTESLIELCEKRLKITE
ncbi:MAG: phosphotransferase [Prochloraceae cyanobacterium]|nr:phosphotransferase [Prochloraceae cyanobacterium]